MHIASGGKPGEKAPAIDTHTMEDLNIQSGRNMHTDCSGFKPSGRLAAWPLVVTAAFLLFFVAGCAANSGTVVKGTTPAASTEASAEAQWGIHIMSIRNTAEGHMLDLRYEVTDPDKASAVLNPDSRPYLVHKRTGKVLAVPNLAKVGRLQQTTNPPVKGVVYFMFFGNSRLVAPGDEVSLVIGDANFDGLMVE